MKNKIYIGDNLKIMSSPEFDKYREKVDFIYIDPPYNTNNKNLSYFDTNKKWSENIEDRLIIAKDLLANNGSIFISIDDNELSNLMTICYRVFGKQNYIGLFITRQAVRSNAKYINTIHEYVLVFAKNKKYLPKFFIKRLKDPNDSNLINSIIKKVNNAFKISKSEAEMVLKKEILNYVKLTGKSWIKNYTNISAEGKIFFAKDLSTLGKPNRLDIDDINLHLKPLKTRRWSSEKKFLELYKANKLHFKGDRPYEIQYITEAIDNVPSILNFYSRQGTNELKKLGLYGLFDTPKPVELIKFLIRCSQHKNATILDFYAGSGTTGQAVYEINKEDNKNHNYILVQLDEPINKKSISYEILKNKGFSSPKVSDILLYRLNTFLKLNNIEDDFEIKDNCYE